VKDFFIANRTVEKAEFLAAKLGGQAIALSDSLKKIEEVDILLASLGGGASWLKRGEVEQAMRNRKGRPLFIIDIGVPRNVEPETGRIESVYLYNIDDLSSIADGNRAQRQKAVEAAESILREEVDRLCDWLTGLELVPTIVRLRQHFEKIRQSELTEFLGKNGELTEKERKAVERLTHDLIGRLLHDPSVNLRGIVHEADRFEYARMLNDIFLKNNRQNPG
jgi:glutamyl-tRNA reductase